MRVLSTARLHLGSLVKHYKNGKVYKIMGVATDVATQAPVVVYRERDQPRRSFVRPEKEFVAFVPIGGPDGAVYVPRFDMLLKPYGRVVV